MNRNHIDSLTWLRALAAFLVVASHSIRVSEASYSAADSSGTFLPLALLDGGTYGVYLFFALSGCTLFLSNHNKLNSVSLVQGFVIKRFFRIWPAFAVSLLVYILFISVFKRLYTADESLWIAQFLKEYTFLDILVYLSLFYNITGPSNLFQGAYWSLPVEFQYYLMLPICAFFMKSRIGSILAPLMFGGILYLLYSEDIITSLDRNEVLKMAYAFFGGVLIAVFYKWIPFALHWIFCVAIISIVTLFVGLSVNDIVVVPDQIPFASEKANFYGLCALLSTFIALNMRAPQVDNRLTRLLRTYGEISYSIYLYHMIFVGISALLLVHFEITSNAAKQGLVLALSLFGSYYLSKITYRYIEMPAIDLGRNLSKRKALSV